MKNKLMKPKKREKLITEAEDLIKRMNIKFIEAVEEETLEDLSEGEEEMKENTKIIMKILEAIKNIKKIGKSTEVVIKNNKMIKLSISQIMKIINLYKIVMKKRLLRH